MLKTYKIFYILIDEYSTLLISLSTTVFRDFKKRFQKFLYGFVVSGVRAI